MPKSQKNKGNLNIFITGGHLTPALAVIDSIHKLKPEWKIFFIGRRRATETDREESEEYRIITARGEQFLSLTTGRMLFKFSWQTVISILKMPVGILQSVKFINRYKPRLILSFGGYVGLPVAIVGKIFGIPLIIHEQTSKPGLSNIIAAKLANVVCVSDEKSVEYFPRKITKVTGLPIRSELFGKTNIPDFIRTTNLPVIYVTGGVTGAKSLNSIIYNNLSFLLENHIVVHQVGRSSVDEAQNLKSGLPVTLRERYIILAYADIKEHAWLMQNSEFNISRSGANTVGESVALAKPVLYVPLPWSRNNEQFYNAKKIADYDACMIIDQTEIDAQSFQTRLNSFITRLPETTKNISQLAVKYPRHAADAVVKLMAEILYKT